jgi:hypothetical protein
MTRVKGNGSLMLLHKGALFMRGKSLTVKG